MRLAQQPLLDRLDAVGVTWRRSGVHDTSEIEGEPRRRIAAIDRDVDQGLPIEHLECPVHRDVVGLVVRELNVVKQQRPVTAVDPQMPLPTNVSWPAQRRVGCASDVERQPARFVDLKAR